MHSMLYPTDWVWVWIASAFEQNWADKVVGWGSECEWMSGCDRQCRRTRIVRRQSDVGGRHARELCDGDGGRWARTVGCGRLDGDRCPAHTLGLSSAQGRQENT